MKHWIRFGALVLFISLMLVGAASAQDGAEELVPLEPAAAPDSSTMVNETSGLWFVELAGTPLADGGRAAEVQRNKADFRQEARRVGLQYRERLAFDTLWNGLSVIASPSELAKLNRMSSVKAVYAVETIPIPDVSLASNPELATALAMTGADIAQSELGYTGAGIKVAVMDTGIDYDHPDLGGCFGSGCRVFTGWDFVGDAFNADPSAPDYNPVPSPDDDPDDCNGHGTHVAGIVGANGEVVGVAPDVTFAAYRVFGCTGSTTADIMIAAMERALADDVDVLNMSIGSAFNNWEQYPTAKAADLLVKQGVVVVASIGNSGANGVYSAGAPGVGSRVIGVASFDNTHISALTFNVNPSGQQVPYLPLSTTEDPPTSGTSAEVVYVGQGCNADTYLADPNGKVALITRGACTFNEKYARAFSAGAVGVVIHNNVTGLFAGGGITNLGIFGIGISLADGTHIRSLLDGGEIVTLDWTDVRINAVNPTGGLISSFSSYGLGAELALKPDIGAPGGLIRSTYPLENGGYAIISGTSMASPHVAGAAALYLEAAPQTPASVMRDILQNTAEPKLWWGSPALGFLDNVHRQGAGMVQIDDAILSTTTIMPGKLSVGEGEAGPRTYHLTLKNQSGSPVTYSLSYVNALSTGGSTFAPGFYTSNASVAFSSPTVTVPAWRNAGVNVTITPASSPDRGQYGGYIVFTPEGGGQVLRVPFAGFIGDYQSIPVMTSGGSGFPLVGRATSCIRVVEGACIGGSFTLPPADYVYGMADVFNQPSFLVHLDHQARLLRAEVFSASRGRPWHTAFEEQYLPRNSTPGGFFAFTWDGTTTRGNHVYVVPDGQYVVVLSLLKAGGDFNNPAHWETWTSPVITIDRP